MSIKIGNNNKISHSTIANNVEKESPKKSWYENHQILGGIIVSFIPGILVYFIDDIMNFLEEIL